MSQDSQKSPASPFPEHAHLGGGGDVLNQLQRTRQWEADGSHLLRPAAFHTWAATSWERPQ